METREINIRIAFGRRAVLAALTALFVFWHPGFIGSETLQMTTYYPAPYGGYVSILTTDNTTLARNAGRLAVGLGNPTEKMHVFGNSITSGNETIGGNSTVTGTVRWGNAGSMLNADQGGAIELGAWGTPYIDFKNNSAQDFSARIILSQPGRLQVNGDLEVTGSLVNTCYRVGYGTGGWTPCPANTRVVGFLGDGVARVSGFLPAGQTTSSVGTFIILGEDWGGTMVCCKF